MLLLLIRLKIKSQYFSTIFQLGDGRNDGLRVVGRGLQHLLGPDGGPAHDQALHRTGLSQIL